MSSDSFKVKAASAALDFIKDKTIIGIGTGSTVNYFIDELALIKHKVEGCVASSCETKRRLIEHGITVFDLCAVDELSIYVDGADEVTAQHAMIKGGGGALTREKIIASVALEFICIVDETKLVEKLGKFPVAVEVLPMARSYVAREIVKLGGDPTYRQGFVTDNGNIILDVFNLNLSSLSNMEEAINNLTGVVDNGIFSKCLADKVIVSGSGGVRIV